jgi:steroid delta-isomerase-like uncharacterized protein
MSVVENKAILYWTVERVNAGDFDALWDVMDDDCLVVDHTGEFRTKDDFRRTFEAFAHAHPDYHVEIEDVVAEEDRVAVRSTESGTWKERYLGREPTGRSAAYPAIEIWRFADGKVTGMWMARDMLTAAIQTGRLPEPD